MFRSELRIVNEESYVRGLEKPKLVTAFVNYSLVKWIEPVPSAPAAKKNDPRINCFRLFFVQGGEIMCFGEISPTLLTT